MKILQLKFNRLRLYPGVAMLLFLSLVFGVVGYEYMDERDLAAIDTKQVERPDGKVNIVIKVKERTLEVHNNDELHKTYRIAVGKQKTPTPIGEWQVVWKDYNWGTGFGSRWMGLNVPWGIYGIHGTNKPWSIGQFASHGCIRMRNKDVEELFEWVPIGTPVRIEGQRMKVQRTLKYQIVGSDVAILQYKLKEMGYLNSRADGIFGKVTEEAVKALQQQKGLTVTGVVDKQMLQLLGI